MIKILDIDNNIIYESKTTTFKKAIEEATKSNISLNNANLVGTDLREANLVEANLYEVDLYGGDLTCVDLRGANLRDADLTGVDLYGADLQGANLYGANFQGADLTGADLRGANLQGANLYGANLHEATGVRTFTAGNNNRLCYTYVYNNEQRWNLGCFNGNYEETRKAVKAKYGKDSHYYMMIKATRESVETQEDEDKQ
jgi:hypothetical protein